LPLNLVLKQILQVMPRFMPGTTQQKFREEFNNAVHLIAKPTRNGGHNHTGGEAAIKARIYRPGARGRLPAMAHYYGGDFVLGNIEIHDRICRKIARLSGAVVISVDYRLVPEHKFPAAVEDTYDAAERVADNDHSA
jgi:acetyl esterase/lipase